MTATHDIVLTPTDEESSRERAFSVTLAALAALVVLVLMVMFGGNATGPGAQRSYTPHDLSGTGSSGVSLNPMYPASDDTDSAR